MSQDKAFFGHPRGLATLFFTEMWERFSYYGIRALLILFMTASVERGGLGFDVVKASAIYGLYTSLVYMLSLPGGWIADRFLGLRQAVLVGGVLIALGNISLALPTLTFFYIGLGLIVLGTGLLKPNVSAIVGRLYAQGDVRRDSGFSIFYMGINLGAFLSPLIVGYIGERVNWRYGFALSAVGMAAGLIQYMWGSKYLGDAGLHPVPPENEQARARDRRLLAIGSIALVAAVALPMLLQTAGVVSLSVNAINDAFGWILLATVIVAFVWLLGFGDWTPVERRRLFAVAFLFWASVLFWSVFEQAGSTLNLFAERNTYRVLFGYAFPASWYQSVNSLLIITSLGPLFAWMWIKLGRHNPSSGTKFAMGLVFAGLGFVVLIGPSTVAETGAQVSPWWLFLTYLLHTIGELALSPVGLSAMTKLAPERVGGLMMGIWFLSISVGNYLGARVSAFYESMPLPTLFGAVGAFAIACGIVLAMFARPIRRLMGGAE